MIIGITSTFEQRQEGKASDGQVAGIKMTRCVIAMLLPSHCSALFPTGNFHYLIICIVFSSHYLLQIVLKDNLKNSTKLSSAFELLKFSFQQNSMFDQNDPVCHCYAAVSPLHNAQIVN